MKRGIVCSLAAAIVAFSGLFGFTACDGGEKWGDVYTIDAAYERATELGYSGTLEEFVESIRGKDGADGVGIKSFEVNSSGELIITLTNGEKRNCGKVTGNDGTGIARTYIDENGNLIVVLSDDREINCGKVTGNDGATGVGVKDAYIDSDGSLIIVLTDGKKINCGKVAISDDVQSGESLYYSEVKSDGEVTGYTVRGLGSLSSTDVVIPSRYKGKPVVSIGENAFFNCKYIQSVTIPDSVKIIEYCAFWGCKSLESVYIGGGVEEISECAFTECTALKQIDIPSNVKKIGENAFASCFSLERIDIAYGVTEIGRSAFTGCLNVQNLVIPDSVTMLGYGVFMNGGFKNVKLSSNLTELPDYCFAECVELEQITVTEKVEVIGYSAFYSLPALKSILLPSGLKQLASYSIYMLDSLENIFYCGTAADWEKVKKNKGNELDTVSFYSETAPVTQGRFWRYVDGRPTAW